MPDRIGDWIQTQGGKRFYPLRPLPEDVDIEDIAHALSMLCRYGGHCDRFYSVAQHSYLASYYCEDHRWGLLHDAAEAYLVDVPRPIKPYLGMYKSFEQQVLAVIAEKFGLEFPMPKSVKAVDMLMLATEKRDLLKNSEKWGSIKGIHPIEEEIIPWPPERAKREFINRFKQLFEVEEA